jgi:putative ABC transport system permease protein
LSLILKLIFESLRFSINALRTNLLRTILSLLGVTIGIFAIISVFTLVDSLEKGIRDSLSFLGPLNIDISRFPLEFGPNVPWWEYIKRPPSTYDEYEFLRENLKNAQGISIFGVTNTTAKFQSGSSQNLTLLGIADGHKVVYQGDFEDLQGRYFTDIEFAAGRKVAILGHRPVQELFNGQDPIGREIKLKGMKFTVIATIKEQGDGLFGGNSLDENVYIPYRAFKQIYYVGKGGLEPNITIKGKEEDVGLVQIEYETEGLLRKYRGLKPKEKSNFALVRQQAVLNQIGSVFDVLSVAGWVIGGFSILVGGFGIANIMFVSVRERTSLIGIQKSLGAKNYFILFQFLFESIFLSVLGGGIGIFMVYLLSFINLGTLDLTLTLGNIFLGLGVSAIIGMASGIIPAALAARMDPVIAIRSQ